MNLRKILVIDDTEECRKLLCMMLPTVLNHIEIVEAVDGEDAVSLLAKTSDFNLVISDYTMPNGNGAFVFKYLQEQGLKIPFILFTVLTDCDMNQFRGDSFVGISQKHDLVNLQSLVRKVMSRSQQINLNSELHTI